MKINIPIDKLIEFNKSFLINCLKEFHLKSYGTDLKEEEEGLIINGMKGYSEPSKEFILKYNLDKNLFEEWPLPFDENTREENQLYFIYLLNNRNIDGIINYFVALRELNQEFGRIITRDCPENILIERICDLCLSAISCFNFNDMYEYINMGNATIKKNEEYYNQRNFIEEKTGYMEWVPSYFTMRLIYIYLKKILNK
jgi:hypothetical protein